MKKGKKAIEWWTQQRDMFELVRESRPHTSIISWKYIVEPKAVCFAHILPKWMYVKYRHDPRNIALVYDEHEHHELDAKVMRNRHIILDILERWWTYDDIEKEILLMKLPCN